MPKFLSDAHFSGASTDLSINGDVILTNTSSTRGIFRNDNGYDLRLGGGVNQADGAYISLSGGARGGGTSVYKGRVEIFAGGDNYSAQADITGDIVIGAHWSGGDKTILHLDSSSDNADFAGNINVNNGKSVFAAAFYERTNTSYLLDPAGGSNIATLTSTGITISNQNPVLTFTDSSGSSYSWQTRYKEPDESVNVSTGF
jgi:hypothetical protein